jgi:hypothetical protein
MEVTRQRRTIGDPNTLLALTVIQRALDDIENEADEEALQWVREPDTGRLSLRAACRVAGCSVEAVQDEARERLDVYYSDDDPITHDRVDDLQTLLDHERDWITKKEAAELCGVSTSAVGGKIERGKVESVLAPKGFDTDLPARYVILDEIQAEYQ